MKSQAQKTRALAKAALKLFRAKREAFADALTEYSATMYSANLHWEIVEQVADDIAAGKYQLRVLYVEDDPQVSSAMLRWFERQHCTVRHATSANKAVSLLNEKGADFDAVVTDWNLIGWETGDVVADEATKLGLPVRILSGALCMDPRWARIWISKGFNEDVLAFLDGLRT